MNYKLVAFQIYKGISPVLNQKETSDMEVSGGGATFRVHKGILAAKSPVFKSAFQSQMKETAVSSYELADYSPDAVQVFLEFFYTDMAAITGNTLLELIHLAEQYDVAGLRQQLAAFIVAQGAQVIRDVFTILYEDSFHFNSFSQFKNEVESHLAAAFDVTPESSLQLMTLNLDLNLFNWSVIDEKIGGAVTVTPETKNAWLKVAWLRIPAEQDMPKTTGAIETGLLGFLPNPATMESVIALLDVAAEYKLTGLKNALETKLGGLTTRANVLEMLDICQKYYLPSLRKETVDVIADIVHGALFQSPIFNALKENQEIDFTRALKDLKTELTLLRYQDSYLAASARWAGLILAVLADTLYLYFTPSNRPERAHGLLLDAITERILPELCETIFSEEVRQECLESGWFIARENDRPNAAYTPLPLLENSAFPRPLETLIPGLALAGALLLLNAGATALDRRRIASQLNGIYGMYRPSANSGESEMTTLDRVILPVSQEQQYQSEANRKELAALFPENYSFSALDRAKALFHRSPVNTAAFGISAALYTGYRVFQASHGHEEFNAHYLGYCTEMGGELQSYSPKPSSLAWGMERSPGLWSFHAFFDSASLEKAIDIFSNPPLPDNRTEDILAPLAILLWVYMVYTLIIFAGQWRRIHNL